MYETMTDSNASNVRSWIALGTVALAALTITVLFSPAIGVFDLGPQKQVTASIR